jgi:hypothetical protein
MSPMEGEKVRTSQRQGEINKALTKRTKIRGSLKHPSAKKCKIDCQTKQLYSQLDTLKLSHVYFRLISKRINPAKEKAYEISREAVIL